MSLLSSLIAFAQAGDRSFDNQTFLKRAAESYQSLQSQPPPQQNLPETGQTGFIPLTRLIRGQAEISVDNIRQKLIEKIGLKDVIFDSAGQLTGLAHDQGRSPVPLNDPIEVVKGPDGYVILDGHHDVYLALFLSAKTVAAMVKEDLSKLSRVDFWRQLKARRLVYLPETAEELAQNPPLMQTVHDNPNRYLAALVALKVSVDPASARILKAKGSKTPIWIKVNNSIPFIEFYIADALTKAGIIYDANWGANIPADVVEKSRAALTAAAGSENLSLIPVLKDPQTAQIVVSDQSALQALLRSFESQVKQKTCSSALQGH